MVQTEVIENPEDGNNSVEPENPTDVPVTKKKSKKNRKSPTPNIRAPSQIRERSVRSSTPFSLYLNRHSEDPEASNKFRSITPFINRSSKEKTPFELGKDIKAQMISHKMVFDRASVMDISSESEYAPARYITSDMSVIDRASVMDVSNVEVIYMVEEYDDDDEEQMYLEQVEVEEEATKKKKVKKGRKSKSVDKEDSPASVDGDGNVIEKKSKATKKKIDKKKKKKIEDDDDEEERSPTPAPLPKLKLEIGGGSKMNKKMFEQKSFGPDAKPPPKANKTTVQFEDLSNKQHKQITSGDNSTRNSEIRDGDSMQGESKEGSVATENLENELNENPEDNNEQAEIKDNAENNIDGNNTENSTDQPNNSETENKTTAEAEELLKSQTKDESKKETKKDDEDEDKPTPEQIKHWETITAEEGADIGNKIKKFILQKRNDPQNPCFISYLPNSFSREGLNLRLVCAVNGVDLKIKWYRGTEEIKSNDRYIIKANENNILSLEILKLIPADSGEYSCLIYNRKKKSRSACFVSVYDISKFQDMPEPSYIEYVKDSYHYIKDEIIFECKVRGCPRPLVTWSKQDQELSPNHVCTEEAHGIHRMILSHPTPKDSGIYVVKAENSRGIHQRLHVIEFLINTEKVHVEEVVFDERALAIQNKVNEEIEGNEDNEDTENNDTEQAKTVEDQDTLNNETGNEAEKTTEETENDDGFWSKD